jgi:multiple sugar transport system substrate-binding protein
MGLSASKEKFMAKRKIAKRSVITLSAVLALLGGSVVPTQAADPVTLTMWSRSVTAVQSQDMVNAFNKEYAGKIEVKLTVVPFAEYLVKVSAAAATNSLPDILAANVIDGPNYSKSGFWKDINSEVRKLSYFKKLAPAHLAAGRFNYRYYAVPHVTDASSIYYNKVLFKKAGLDPEKPPKTLNELATMAKKIADIDGAGGIGGLYFPGNCGGCLAFTLFPSMWANGAKVLNFNGTSSDLGQSKASAVLDIYRGMFKDGSMMPESRNEAGATQNAVFESGNAGFALLGSKALGTIKSSDKLEIGIAPLPGVSGGQSTFVGGDIVGISSNAKNAAAAWTFIKWTLDEKPQIDLYAAKNFLTSRTDLAKNSYAVKDSRIMLLNSLIDIGKTPMSVRFFQTFNDANGPWISFVRASIFGDAKPNYKTLVEGINKSLAQS